MILEITKKCSFFCKKHSKNAQKTRFFDEKTLKKYVFSSKNRSKNDQKRSKIHSQNMLFYAKMKEKNAMHPIYLRTFALLLNFDF